MTESPLYRSITYMSRRCVEKVALPEQGVQRVLISMSSPVDGLNGDWCRPAKIAFGTFVDTLKLVFHDDDHRHIYHNETKIVPINDEQGYEILRFLKKHEGNDYELYINCEGGISRSAGVAMFAKDYYGVPIWKFDENSSGESVLYKFPVVSKYNKRVYHTLIKLYGICFNGGGKISPDELPAANAFQNYMKERTDGKTEG